LGCVFTQTGVDASGHPQRDEESTTYAGAIESADVFSKRIYEEARRRGMEKAEQVCVIGDGAPWIWNIADEQFYGAVQIVDLYHAREHYWDAGRALIGNKEALKALAEDRKRELDNGKVEEVVAAIGGLPAITEEEKAAKEREKRRSGARSMGWRRCWRGIRSAMPHTGRCWRCWWVSRERSLRASV